MLLRLLAFASVALLATAGFAAETTHLVEAAPTCTPIAADQVPAEAKEALVKAGADPEALATCTKEGVVRYCATVTGEDGRAMMIEVDAAGAALGAGEPVGACGACACGPTDPQ